MTSPGLDRVARRLLRDRRTAALHGNPTRSPSLGAVLATALLLLALSAGVVSLGRWRGWW